VHGLTREDLAAKPKFAEVAAAFLDYVRGAELIIHNADFDVEFLNMELARAGFPPLEKHVARITDTLLSAKELHPGKKNSLDALCERYFIDNSRRTLHGALADARLLAECYLAMTRGQESLMMELEAPAAAAAAAAGLILDVSKLIVQRATPEELAAHEQYLDAMEKDAKAPTLWRRILGSA
jgi:DNA polymerase III subunit epsilon